MATKYTVKGIQSELQNVTSENDAVIRHTINSNTNRLYAQNNCGIYEHIGEGLSCIASATSVRVNVGMGCLYGRDFEVLSNTLVEVEQNTSGFIVAVYDGNVVDGKERFYLTSIKNTDSYIQQDLLNDGKTFMMKLCGYVATTQVDDVIDVEIAQLNDESMISELNNLASTKAEKVDLAKKVDLAIGNGTKTSWIGKTDNGTLDMRHYHDVTNKTIGYVRSIGDDKFGYYFDYNTGRFKCYTGTGSGVINIANATELTQFAKLSGATFTGQVTAPNIDVTTLLTAKSITSDLSVVVNDGRFEARGTDIGLQHIGTGGGATQNVVVARNPDGNFRAIIKDEAISTAKIHFTGFNSGGTTATRGIICSNDYVRHVTTSGSRSLAHLDEVTMRTLRTLELMQIQQEQLNLVTEVVSEDNPQLASKMRGANSQINKFVDELVGELEEVMMLDEQENLELSEDDIVEYVDDRDVIIMNMQKQLEQQAEENAKMQEQLNIILESEDK